MDVDRPELNDTTKEPIYLGQPFEYWMRRFREVGDDDDRYVAVEALASFGEKSIPFLLEAIQYQDYWYLASSALEHMGLLTFSAVTTLLQSPNPFLRKKGVRLLMRLWGEATSLTYRLLCDFLEDEDAGVRCEAAKAMEELRWPLRPRSVTALVKAARDSDARVRSRAVKALKWIDSEDEEGIACLLEAFQDSDVAVRLAAVESLQSVKPKSEKAFEFLTSFRDPVEGVQIAVKRLLKVMAATQSANQPEPDLIVSTEARPG